MTNSTHSVTSKQLVSVVMFAPGSRELTVTNLKQVFSMKPEHWLIDVHLVIENANEATLKVVESLGLKISVIEVKGNMTSSRSLRKVVGDLPKNGDAVLWLGAGPSFHSDAYIQVNSFHKQYPNAVLVGQFKDEATSQISAGGYGGSGFVPGNKSRIQAQTLPVDVTGFDDNLVFVPASAAKKIGQPTKWAKKMNKHGFYVASAKRKGIRCLAIPGFLGNFHK